MSCIAGLFLIYPQMEIAKNIRRKFRFTKSCETDLPVQQHPRERGSQKRGKRNPLRATALVSSNHWRWLAVMSKEVKRCWFWGSSVGHVKGKLVIHGCGRPGMYKHANSHSQYTYMQENGVQNAQYRSFWFALCYEHVQSLENMDAHVHNFRVILLNRGLNMITDKTWRLSLWSTVKLSGWRLCQDTEFIDFWS